MLIILNEATSYMFSGKMQVNMENWGFIWCIFDFVITFL